ncbi:hypothetical protein [Paraburkholderia caribensis]|uniref:hypothetical protein n=1 Tax=Paraburkholderia caribensis TaxID=75105 RepID=UPI0034D202F3
MLKNMVFCFLLFALVGAARADTLSCSIAGGYTGNYNGPDTGLVRVNVAVDGKLDGELQSQNSDRSFVIGGVVRGDGTLATSGAVSSGAVFTGRFENNAASGIWSKPVIINGSQQVVTGRWSVRRTTAADGCQ